jgi:hypothetical protein
VNAFLRHAEEIFLTARTAGTEECDMALLVNADGAIHVVPAEEWNLEPLRIHHGARAAYRVSRSRAGVRLEARSAAGQCCVLEAPGPQGPVRGMLPDYPQYQIAPEAPIEPLTTFNERPIRRLCGAPVSGISHEERLWTSAE